MGTRTCHLCRGPSCPSDRTPGQRPAAPEARISERKGRTCGYSHLGVLQDFLQGLDPWAPAPRTFADTSAEVGGMSAHTCHPCRPVRKDGRRGYPHPPGLRRPVAPTCGPGMNPQVGGPPARRRRPAAAPRAQRWPPRVPAPDRSARRRNPRLGRLRETPGQGADGDGASPRVGGRCAKMAAAGTHTRQVCAIQVKPERPGRYGPASAAQSCATPPCRTGRPSRGRSQWSSAGRIGERACTNPQVEAR